MVQNQKQQHKSIVETSVDIDPVAVVYNIENHDIESFVANYISSIKGVHGLEAVRVHVVRDGNRNPEVALYAFFAQNSKDVFSNVQNVPQHLRHKMDLGGYKATDKMFQAMRPVVKEFKLMSDFRNNLVYVKLDIFKVVGLMLGADTRKHALTITEAAKLKKKRALITVIKSNKYVDRDTDSFDKFSNIIERQES